MGDCLFCKIVAGDVPSEKVFEDDEVLVFRDISPKAPTHVLAVPRRHIASLDAASESDRAVLARLLLSLRDVARDEGIAESGYRVVTNCGENGGQTVDHIHFHLLGGRGLGWPPG